VLGRTRHAADIDARNLARRWPDRHDLLRLRVRNDADAPPVRIEWATAPQMNSILLSARNAEIEEMRGVTSVTMLSCSRTRSRNRSEALIKTMRRCVSLSIEA